MTTCTCEESESSLKKIDHPANGVDWSGTGETQSYQFYKCSNCGRIWGCRHQYDSGTGRDDRWKDFGIVSENEVSKLKRHY